MIEGANILIRNRKAYIPTFGRTPDGLNLVIDPVHVVDLRPEEMVAALEKVISAGMPRVPALSRKELQKQQSPLLRAAGVKTWKQLARGGQEYAILWEPNQISLVPSKLDTQGRFVDDYSKEKTFPRDAPLIAIIDAILQDARSRPELGFEHNTNDR